MAYLPNVQFQPYIKPYNGSVNQELADTVKTLTTRYDENLQQGTALDILAGQTIANVPDGDRALAEQKVNEVKSQLASIVNSDGGYYSARPRIAQIAAKFKGDPDLAIMMSNKKIQDQEDAVNAQLRAQGHHILNFNRGQFKSVGYDSEGKRAYNTYTPGSEAMHNYHDAQSKYFDQIVPDGGSGGLTHAAMQGFLQTGSWQGITGAKIRNQANRALESYLNTPEGNQQLRKYTQLDGLDPNSAKHNILREMIATGMEKQSSQSATNYIQDPFAIIAAKGATKGKKNSEGMMYPIETDKELPVTNRDDVDAVVYHLTDTKTNQFANLSSVQKDMLWNATNKAKHELGPNASNKDINSYAKNFLHARSDYNMAPAYYAVTGSKEINNENNTFQNGNYTARTYQDIDNPGKIMNWEELKKSIGQKGEADDKVVKTMNVSGFYHPNNTFTQGLHGDLADRFVQPTRLTIQDSNGKTRTIVAGSDLGSTKTFEFQQQKILHEIYLGDRTGRGKRVVFDGESHFVRPLNRAVQVQTPDGQMSEEDGFEVTDNHGNRIEMPASELTMHILRGR